MADVKTVPVSSMTLPVLMGLVTQRILTVLLSQDSVKKQQEIMACRVDVKNWYESQNPDDKKEFAKSVRKTLENFKNVMEQLNMDIGGMTAGDIQ